MSVLCPRDEKQAIKGLHFQLMVSPKEREAEGSLRGETEVLINQTEASREEQDCRWLEDLH